MRTTAHHFDMAFDSASMAYDLALPFVPHLIITHLTLLTL